MLMIIFKYGYQILHPELGLKGALHAYTKSWACKHRGACSSPGDHPIQAEMPKDKTLSKFSIQNFSLGSQLSNCLHEK